MSITEHIRFGTFNIGIHQGDYQSSRADGGAELHKAATRILDATYKERGDLSEKQRRADYEKARDEAVGQIYRTVEVSTAEKLSTALDVISLQEVGDFNRPFIRTLMQNGFKIHIVKDSEKPDTAIALRESHFNTQTNLSQASTTAVAGAPYGKDIAGVVATLTKSKVNLSFLSLHSWGFPIFKKGEDKRYGKRDQENIAHAKEYFAEALAIAQKQPADGAFIGGDMNNNPDNIVEPFVQAREAGYQLKEPPEDTNYLRGEGRKIDFIFGPQLSLSFFKRIWRAIVSIFTSTTKMTITPPIVLTDFNFTVEGNCSDHKPVGVAIFITKQASLFSRIWNCKR